MLKHLKHSKYSRVFCLSVAGTFFWFALVKAKPTSLKQAVGVRETEGYEKILDTLKIEDKRVWLYRLTPIISKTNRLS